MPKGTPAFLEPLLLLVERYGLDGQPPRSVRETARRHRLSVERVRALESRVVLALKGAFAREVVDAA